MVYIPQANDTGAGVRRQLADLEDVFVARDITVSSNDSYAIYGTFSGHSVNVQGTVSAAASAITLGNDAALDNGQRLVIGQDAYVAAASWAYAVNIAAYDSRLDNAGEIWAVAYAVSMAGQSDGTSSRLTNSGTIRADLVAVSHTGEEEFHLVNTGRILAQENQTAFDGFGSGDDVIVNIGRMVGGIYMDTGDDSYDGRKGFLDGAVEGGSGNDTILCGTANDRISGGLGKDILAGGKGRDVFVFDGELDGKKNVDTIKDFKPADDTIEIVDGVFEFGMSSGSLSANQFTSNRSGKATDINDRIIYETDTGNLYFDADGKGGEKAVLFAKLGKELNLDHRDFVITEPDIPSRFEDPGLF